MSRRGTPNALLIAGAALLVGLGAWLLARARHPEAAQREEPAPTARRALLLPASVAPVKPDGVSFMPARSDDPRPDGPTHPHPLTPAHERIFRENRIVSALDGAMDVEDVAAMRRFLQEYRDEYPEDDNLLQDGYAVIADCFERPGEASRAAASRWADAHRGSTLRRFVNRHCLDR